MDIDNFTKKYIPLNFEECILHNYTITYLKNIKYLYNIIFFGYEGKKILIKLLLYNLFNKKIIIKTQDFIHSNKTIKFNYSDYHIEIDIKLISKQEKLLLKLIKEYISTLSIIDIPYKIVILYNFDLLDKKFQFQFRTLIEKSYLTTKFILHSKNYSGIISPLKSRFLNMRIPSTEDVEITKFIKLIAKDNNLKISKSIIEKIISHSKNFMNIISIRKILYIMYIKIQSSNFKIRYQINFDSELFNLKKELYSNKEIIKKFESLNLLILDLLEKNYSYKIIIKYILDNIIDDKEISNKIKFEIIKETTQLENMCNVSRIIINLEYFLTMILYKLS